MKNIAVIGVGYVGLVTGTCFADMGNHVICLDVNEERIANLRKGIMPIYEPGLEEMVRRNVNAGRLSFETSYTNSLNDPECPANMVFIAVGTPEGVDGEADLRYVRAVAESVADVVDHPVIIVNKSTVPVGTGDWVADIVIHKQPAAVPFSVVSNPEFLREGTAIGDFLNPDRIVLGSLDRSAAEAVAQLYIPLRAPIMVTDLRTAEMIKYASNAFLATKISFINEIANICEALGADVKEVAVGMGYDKRIGRAFLDAGLGYGGSCFEGGETVFTLNSPNVATETFESVFAKTHETFQGDTVEVAVPTEQRVLSFDLQTGQPALAQVKAMTRRPYKGVMVNLTLSMGRRLRVTADHPVIVRGRQRQITAAGDGLEIIPAISVAPGDQLPALCDLPAVAEATELNLLDLLRGTPLVEDVHVSPVDQSFTEQYDRFGAHIPWEMLRYPDEIKSHNRMPLRVYYHLRDAGVLDAPASKLQLYTAKGAATRINAVIPVDGDLMRLLGYYLAEGYIGKDTGRAGAVRERIGFCFHEQEQEYIADVRRILSKLGLKYIERNSTRCTTTIVSSRIFAWLLRDVLKCGVRSDDKALPRVAFNVGPALRRELVRGAFSGDGAVTPVQDGHNLMFEYATVSKPLADGMAMLLQTLEVIPSIRTRWMNRSKRPAYILRVSGYAQLDALRDVFGDKHRAQIASVLAGYQRHIRQRGFSRQGPFATLTVQDVHYENVDTTVYSMETSTGTLIAASGLICHNCFPKDVSALTHMANVQGKHPQMLQAVIQINADQRRSVINKVRDLCGALDGKTIGILGLAFKPNTDDIRDSPGLDLARMFQEQGALVKAYDPVAMPNAARVLKDVRLCEDSYDLVEGCDAVILATEWNEFKNIDLARVKHLMKLPVFIDGRNLYDPAAMYELGFIYRGLGRGYGSPASNSQAMRANGAAPATENWGGWNSVTKPKGK
ncbi:MAG: nucleotide sugar dehydrogenase [Chloroflexi bacterium]|nr:nucleotide sugar dehydrogenase [Chloroflexota bacterium]MCL5273658.1 nucleotide sugar dehydrogenase [Chloroflexota bacterium]